MKDKIKLQGQNNWAFVNTMDVTWMLLLLGSFAYDFVLPNKSLRSLLINYGYLLASAIGFIFNARCVLITLTRSA